MIQVGDKVRVLRDGGWQGKCVCESVSPNGNLCFLDGEGDFLLAVPYGDGRYDFYGEGVNPQENGGTIEAIPEAIKDPMDIVYGHFMQVVDVSTPEKTAEVYRRVGLAIPEVMSAKAMERAKALYEAIQESLGENG